MNTDIRYSQQDASSHQEDGVMGKQSFTPGPWATHPDQPTQVMDCADESFIADCEGLEPGGRPSNEANARLIAAAPELYETLELVESEGRDANADGDVLIPSCVWDGVRSALAKARGVTA